MLVSDKAAQKLESLMVKAMDINEKVLDGLRFDKQSMSPGQEGYEIQKLSNVCYNLQTLHCLTKRD
jgi:hypothetical protein